MRQMENTIIYQAQPRLHHTLLTISVLFLSMLLHQSGVIFGVNLSLADFFCLIILLCLAAEKQLFIPLTPLVYFIAVSIGVLTTAVFYIPSISMYEPNAGRILSDYIKLLASFSYFLIGCQLMRLSLLKDALKWFSYFGLFIGAIGLLAPLIPSGVIYEVLFFDNTRYRGLMIDPNYFAVLQIASLVYISRSQTLNNRWKLLAFIIILASVLVSGSKTGIITLVFYLCIRLAEYLLLKRKNIKGLFRQTIALALMGIIVPIGFNAVQPFIEATLSSQPSFARIQYLFSDFSSAISESGSGREETWVAARNVIEMSPIAGVGIGTYTDIALEKFHYDNVAHNTFLQLTAEWGIPLAFFFFGYLLFILGKATLSRTEQPEVNMILRDIMVILLIGSMAISLNNARMLWFFFGALVFSVKYGKPSA